MLDEEVVEAEAATAPTLGAVGAEAATLVGAATLAAEVLSGPITGRVGSIKALKGPIKLKKAKGFVLGGFQPLGMRISKSLHLPITVLGGPVQGF